MNVNLNSGSKEKSNDEEAAQVVIVTMSKFPAVFGAGSATQTLPPRRGIPVIAGATTPNSIKESTKLGFMAIVDDDIDASAIELI